MFKIISIILSSKLLGSQHYYVNQYDTFMQHVQIISAIPKWNNEKKRVLPGTRR